MDNEQHQMSRRELMLAAAAVGLSAPAAANLAMDGSIFPAAGALTAADYRFFAHDCVWNRRVDVAPAIVAGVLDSRWSAALAGATFQPSKLALNSGPPANVKKGVPVDAFTSRTTEVWNGSGAVMWPLPSNNGKPYPRPLNWAIQQDNLDRDWLGLQYPSTAQPGGALWEGGDVALFSWFGTRGCLFLVRWRSQHARRNAGAFAYSGTVSTLGAPGPVLLPNRYTGVSSLISGLPQLPLLAHPDELSAAGSTTGSYKGVDHALLMAVPKDKVHKETGTQAGQNSAYANAASAPVVYPATRSDGEGTVAAASVPMGARVRLKSGNPLAGANLSGQARAIYDTLLRYGAYVGLSGPAASNRIDLIASRPPYGTDPVWDGTLSQLDSLTADHFEVVAEPTVNKLREGSFAIGVIDPSQGI